MKDDRSGIDDNCGSMVQIFSRKNSQQTDIYNFIFSVRCTPFSTKGNRKHVL